MSRIVIVRHPSGIKRTIGFKGSSSLGDVFVAASREFNLNHKKHELKLGPEKLDLSSSIDAAKIPETVILEISPKTDSREEKPPMDVLVQMGFADEGYLYERCSRMMNGDQTLWDVVKEVVPAHMTFGDEDICLTNLGTDYKGKARLKAIKLIDLCGVERQLFFMCRRDYLLKAYKWAKRKNRSNPMKSFRPTHQSKAANEQIVTNVNPTMGNPNPGVLELSERRGKLYHCRYISSSAHPSEVDNLTHRQPSEEGKIVVRVVFPEIALLEATFSPDETVKDVADFVKTYLTDDAKCCFYFHTIQPKLIVQPSNKLGNLRSKPSGTLWYCGKFKEGLFRKNIRSSLEGRVFSYASPDIPEESKLNLHSPSNMCSWSPQT